MSLSILHMIALGFSKTICPKHRLRTLSVLGMQKKCKFLSQLLSYVMNILYYYLTF